MHTRHQLGCLLPAASQSCDLPLVAFGLQARVALPAVGVNRAARIDAVLHKGVQAGSRGVLNHAHPNPPGAGPVGLGGEPNQSLSLGFSPPPRLPPTRRPSSRPPPPTRSVD